MFVRLTSGTDLQSNTDLLLAWSQLTVLTQITTDVGVTKSCLLTNPAHFI